MITGEINYEQLLAAVQKHKVGILKWCKWFIVHQSFSLVLSLSVAMFASFRIHHRHLRTSGRIYRMFFRTSLDKNTESVSKMAMMMMIAMMALSRGRWDSPPKWRDVHLQLETFAEKVGGSGVQFLTCLSVLIRKLCTKNVWFSSRFSTLHTIA